MIPIILGAISNAIRGGQWRGWLGLPENYKLFPNDSDVMNAAIFMLVVMYVTFNPILAIFSFASMWLGASMGWGDYIGNLLGAPDDDLEENKVIDFIIRPLKRWPKLWGAAGLCLRGIVWGACLAAPFAYYGYIDTAFDFVVAGTTMPLIYVFADKWITYRIGKSVDNAWGLGEVFFGAVLWSPLT